MRDAGYGMCDMGSRAYGDVSFAKSPPLLRVILSEQACSLPSRAVVRAKDLGIRHSLAYSSDSHTTCSSLGSAVHGTVGICQQSIEAEVLRPPRRLTSTEKVRAGSG